MLQSIFTLDHILIDINIWHPFLSRLFYKWQWLVTIWWHIYSGFTLNRRSLRKICPGLGHLRTALWKLSFTKSSHPLQVPAENSDVTPHTIPQCVLSILFLLCMSCSSVHITPSQRYCNNKHMQNKYSKTTRELVIALLSTGHPFPIPVTVLVHIVTEHTHVLYHIIYVL